MALKTRPPTGRVPWPLVLLEGPEKSGKTWVCAEFSASPRVGQMYWIDLGEGSGDEYGAIPGARYLIVVHDGTFGAILSAVADVRAEAQRASDDGEPPVVLTIDTMLAEWDLLKDWATNRAKGSKLNRRRLAEDPNAEIKVAANYWNDANSRHRQLMRLLMTFPGIVLMTTRGKVTAAIGDDGQPIEGQKEYKVEGQKTLAYDASCWVRLSHTGAVVVGNRSVHHGVRVGRGEAKALPEDWTLEWLIFDALKCDPATAHVRDLVEPKAERTPEQVRDEAVQPETGPERIRELYREARTDLTVLVPNEREDDEELGALLIRLGKARGKASEQQHKHMHAMWRQTEFADDRAGRLQFSAEIVGRDLTTSADLTVSEADLIIVRLTKYVSDSTPPAGQESGAV